MSGNLYQNVRTSGRSALNVDSSRDIYLPTWQPDVVVLGYGTNSPVTLDAGGGFNSHDNKLVIWIRSGYTLAQATTLFNNTAKTSSIRVQYSSIEASTFSNFTTVDQIIQTPSGIIQVELSGGGSDIHQS